MSIGIQNVIEVIDFGLSLSCAVIASMKDGKIDANDIPNFLPPLMAVPAALQEISKVPAELKDLDVSELEQIKKHIIEKLPDVGEKWLTVATEALNIALAAYRIYQVFSKPPSAT